ncbi:MAG: AAA family ATPase [Planctomycetales bacterium]
MSINYTDLATWFSGRSAWLQDAARRMFQNGEITAADLIELQILCRREAGIEVPDLPELTSVSVTAAALCITSTGIPLRLQSLGELKGINALAPRNPLDFGSDDLTVIYGSNGAGKSGYIRVLKHICGGRGVRTLHRNVFGPPDGNQSLKVTYTHAGTAKVLDWTPSLGVQDDLRTVSLFDSDCANVYIKDENEVAYEPPLLSYFRRLVEVCENLSITLKQDIAAKVSAKPQLPDEHATSVGGRWYAGLSHSTTDAAVEQHCSWTPVLEAQLTTLVQRVAEPNPSDKAKALRKTKGHVHSLLTLLRTIETSTNDDALSALLRARTSASDKRRAADEDARTVFENAPLKGIASESWRLLWEAARQFSETDAYPENAFPNVDSDAHCVLCQQPLDATTDARDRLLRFEDFVKGSLASEAKKAEDLFTALLESVPTIPSNDELDALLDLAAITDDTRTKAIRDHVTQLSIHREGFLQTAAPDSLKPLPSTTAITPLTDMETELETAAAAYDRDATTGNRKELADKLRDLRCQKWLSEQKPATLTEILRLREVSLLEKAQRSTNTKALSDKKSALAVQLITGAFVKRFEQELARLGGGRLNVTIENTRTTKGQVWHRVVLKGAQTPLAMSEVLSDGELRVVSIAAFLADVAVNQDSTPFIFDDPISSLDQDYEERTAHRLAETSKTRQVIVFTHRLSLLHLLEQASDKESVNCRIVSLHRETWGAGEPGDPPLPAQKPAKALNSLLDARIPKLKRVRTEEGVDASQIHAKALCGDIRITLERLIEFELLADVVQRFRRPINTMGKIGKLARITSEDCRLFDDLMTKYSRYEHAQPDEAPVALPEPDELESDLESLRSWLATFSKRDIPPAR